MTPDKVREARRELGLSQAAFAELIGVSPRAVKYWERGQRNPSKVAVKRIKDLTGEPWAD